MERKNKRKIKHRILRILALIITVLVIMIVIGTVTFLIVQAHGKQKLRETAKTSVPVIPMELQESQPENATWQDGWVRYQDKIYAYNENIITFLVMGIDKKGEVKAATDYQQGGQADAVFLVACDPDEGQISVIAINRNTMTPIEVYDKDGIYAGTMKAQLTLQHAYGDGMQISCERMKTAVSKLFYELPIHGYCSINMEAIPIINDDIGGVEVTVLEDLTDMDSRLVEDDTVLLKGDMAFWYLKKRDTTEFDSVTQRLERQKQYIRAFMKKLLHSVKQSPSLVLDIYQDAEPYVVTDLTIDEISYFASKATSFHNDSLQIFSLEGETSMGEQFEEFRVDDQALYELILQVFYQEVEEP